MTLRFKKDIAYYRRLRRRRRLISLTIVGLLLLIIVIIVVLILFWQHKGRNSSSQTSQHGRTYDYSPYKTFTTPYFTFQTDQNWQAEPAESTANIYVYRAFKGRLVERDLYVYVNTLPPRLMLTYVLPVDARGNQLSPHAISDHCKTAAPAAYLNSSRNPTDVTIDGVRFTCQVDGTSTTIGTGLSGGSYEVSLPRQSGSPAKYFLLYHDLSFNPRPELFKAITASFKSL